MNFKEVIFKYGYPLISKEIAHKITSARNKPDGKVAQYFEPNNEKDLKYNGNFSVTKWKWLKDSNIPIGSQCCDVMKKKPFKKFEKETGLKPIIGTMASESAIRKNGWYRYGCNAFDQERPQSKPLSFWTEQDIFEYLERFNIPYCDEIYGEIKKDKKGKYYTTGCSRTGCVFCAFGVHLEKEPNRFQQLKVTHPALYNYCMKPIEEGGLGMKEVLERVGVKTE